MINLIKVSSSLDLHDWTVEVSDLESSLDCFSDLLVLEERVDVVVGGDYKLPMLEVDVASFDLSGAGVPICPNLEVVEEARPILV